MINKLIPDQLQGLLEDPANEGVIKEISIMMDDYHKQLKTIFAENGWQELMREIYSTIDQLASLALKEQKVSCHKGCSFCCKNDIEVTVQEVRMLLKYAQDNNVIIDREYINYLTTLMTADPDRLKLQPCLFLKDGLCSIYPVRPVICRSYYVVSPALDCDPSKGLKEVENLWNWDLVIFVAAVNEFLGNSIGTIAEILKRMEDGVEIFQD